MQSETELLALLDELRAFERQFGLGSRFNIFEAINVVRQETRHSNFLAFLLNPAESHGFGDRFLRSLLMAAVANHPAAPIGRLAVAVADCSGALVYRERDHFDLTIQIPELKLMFVIENKIDAGERVDQLADYRKHVETRYGDYRFLGAFLTPDGWAGEDDQWGTLSYGAVATELKRLLGDVTPSPGVALSVQHYVDLIERRIVVSEELIEVCRRIYAQHRVALELINEHGQVPMLAEAFSIFQSKHTELEAFTTRSSDIDFVATQWLKIPEFQVADKARWRTNCPVKFWFRLRPRKLYLRLEVGPVVSTAGFDRAAYVQELRGRVKANEREVKPMFTRIRTHQRAVSDEPDIEEIADAMEELWTNIGAAATVQAVRDSSKAGVVAST